MAKEKMSLIEELQNPRIMKLELRALYGDPYMPKSVVGHWLLICRSLRATRAWLTIGSYGWWRYTDDLKAAQRKLLEFRY